MKNETPPLRLPLRFAWIWILGLVLLALLAKPAFRMVKIWRADFYLKRAEQALAQGNIDVAQEQSLLSLQLNRNQIVAIRILAQITDLKNDPSSLSLWLHVVQSSQATDADRLALADTALRANIPVLADQQLAILLGRLNPPKQVYYLKGLLSVEQGQPALAREWFEKALRLDPGYAQAEVHLGRVELFFSGDSKIERQGLARLRRLVLLSNEWGLTSLRFLIQWGIEHPDRLPYDAGIVGQLRKHPMVQVSDHCLAAEWEMRAYPKRESALVASLIELSKGASMNGKHELALWFNRHRLFEKTVTVFPLDPNAPEDLILIQLDALAALGRWEEISDFLSHDTTTVQPMLRLLFRARVAWEMGNRSVFDLGWSQAVRSARENSIALRYLAGYAEKMGEVSSQIETLEALSQIPEHQLEALLKLVPLYEHLGQTRNLLLNMQRLLGLLPNDISVLNDVAYLGLLLKDPSPSSMERAQQVYSANPKLPAFAVTYALSQLKKGSASAALRALEAIPRSELKAPGWQAVHAAVLQANGRHSEALEMARQIDAKFLKPEEKQLIAEIRPAR